MNHPLPVPLQDGHRPVSLQDEQDITSRIDPDPLHSPHFPLAPQLVHISPLRPTKTSTAIKITTKAKRLPLPAVSTKCFLPASAPRMITTSNIAIHSNVHLRSRCYREGGIQHTIPLGRLIDRIGRAIGWVSHIGEHCRTHLEDRCVLNQVPIDDPLIVRPWADDSRLLMNRTRGRDVTCRSKAVAGTQDAIAVSEITKCATSFFQP
jgi:hypothetical protein